MKISVIMPVYNSADFVERALDSLKAQTCEDFQVIIIDDGSKDNSLEILNKYAENDARFEVYHKENEGIALAYKYAFKYVTGEYITFVDSDDYLKPDALQFLVDAIGKYKTDIVQYGIDYFNEKWEQVASLNFEEKEITSSDAILLNYLDGVNAGKNNPSLGIRAFKRDLFNGFNYFSGSLGVDEMLTYYSLSKAESIHFVNSNGYCCLRRTDSVSRAVLSEAKVKGQMYVFNALSEITENVCNEIKVNLAVKKLFYFVSVYDMFISVYGKKQARADVKKEYSIYSENKSGCKLSSKKRLLLFCLRFIPVLLKLYK